MFLKNLCLSEAASFVLESIIFNLNILFPMLPFFGKSRKTKYKKAIKVEIKVLNITSDGCWPFISGKITKIIKGISIMIAVIIKSTKKAPILFESISFSFEYY